MPVWDGVNHTKLFKTLERQHCLAARIIFGFSPDMPREHKIHTFEPTCNVLFIIWRLKQKAGIVTSLNGTTLTNLTYGKYATRVPGEVVYGIYEWFSSQ